MRWKVAGAFWLIMAFWVLALPLGWMVSAFITICVHELCHIGAVKLLGGRVTMLELGPGGVWMEAEGLSQMGAVLSSLAGPLGTSLLLLLYRFCPRLAVCAVVHSAYNLLPVYPLDGGRALMTLGRMGGKHGAAAARAAGMISCMALVLIAVFFRFPAAVLLLIPVIREKFLAMRREKGYNRSTIIKG